MKQILAGIVLAVMIGGAMVVWAGGPLLAERCRHETVGTPGGLVYAINCR